MKLYDVGQQGGILYMAGEYMEGGSLAQPARPFSRVDVLKAMADASFGAHALHEVGIAHRSIRPGNILIGPSGAKLGDVGLSQLLSPGQTITGASRVSTIEYLPPELIQGQHASRASDIWAVGATMHKVLTGQPLYPDLPTDSLVSALRYILNERPTMGDALRNGERHIIEATVAVDPADRPATADALAEAIANEAKRQEGAGRMTDLDLRAGQIHRGLGIVARWPDVAIVIPSESSHDATVDEMFDELGSDPESTELVAAVERLLGENRLHSIGMLVEATGGPMATVQGAVEILVDGVVMLDGLNGPAREQIGARAKRLTIRAANLVKAAEPVPPYDLRRGVAPGAGLTLLRVAASRPPSPANFEPVAPQTPRPPAAHRRPPAAAPLRAEVGSLAPRRESPPSRPEAPPDPGHVPDAPGAEPEARSDATAPPRPCAPITIDGGAGTTGGAVRPIRPIRRPAFADDSAAAGPSRWRSDHRTADRGPGPDRGAVPLGVAGREGATGRRLSATARFGCRHR